jgi:hypothetical protein
MLLLAVLVLPWSSSTARAMDETIAVQIRVAPRRIVLFAKRQGNWVTVHAKLPFEDVDLESPLSLNQVAVDHAKPDRRGDLVAKVRLTSLAEMEVLSPPFTVLVLEGYTVNGQRFAGSCTAAVRNQRGR